MNTLNKTLFFIFSMLLIISGCKKDKDKPLSFVDDYKAPLTEAKGVTHAGDFFPLNTGYSWTWEGTEASTGTMTMTYGSRTTTEDIDESNPVISFMNILAPQSITLESGAYTLYPTDEPNDMTRYFEKAVDGVYLRAIQTSGGSILEVENPVFIRNPLVVGDQWEAQPSVDINQLIRDEGYPVSEDDVQMTMNCVLYVVGKEDLQWEGGSVETVRLDERAEANLVMNASEQGVDYDMNIQIKMTVFLNLLDDVGIVQQISDMAITLNITMSYGGEKYIIKINMDSDGTLTLSDYAVGEKSSDVKKSNNLEEMLKAYTDNEQLQNQIIRGVRIANKIKKLSF